MGKAAVAVLLVVWVAGCDRDGGQKPVTPIPSAPAATVPATTVGGIDPAVALADLNSAAQHWAEAMQARERDLIGKSNAPADRYGVTYSVRSADVRKSDSLVYPVVGVVKFKRTNDSTKSYDFVTVTVAPLPGKKWKCLSGQRQIQDEVHPRDWYEGARVVVEGE